MGVAPRAFPLLTSLLLAVSAHAGDSSGVFGTVRDAGGRALPDVDVQIQSESTGARWKTSADDAGHYSVNGLASGAYKVTVRMPGFRTVSKVGAVVDSSEGLRVDFAMELLGLHEMITVEGGGDALDPAGGSSLLVARGSPGNALPASGPDYRMLFDLAPGVVITPAGVGDGGQFSSNGQRPNSSLFRVDGVSANTGVGASILPGAFPGASLPSMSQMGSTENLASPETTESVELRSNSFAPEFGSRPGAEALISTRSGSNDLHAEFFAHLRDRSWNARDWFGNAATIAFPRPSYQGFGGVVGGPLFKNTNTYFFLSAQSSVLQDSAIQLLPVPSSASRSTAPLLIQGILSVFPLPTGPTLPNGEDIGLMQLGRSASLQNYTLRVDHTLGSWGTVFTRLNVASSGSTSAPLAGATQGATNWGSLTSGVTAGKSAGLIYDFRFNYSGATLISKFYGTPAAYAVIGLAKIAIEPSNISSLLPQFDNVPVHWGISVPGLGQFISGTGGMNGRQGQWEFRGTVSKTLGRHDLRFGLDGFRLQPTRSTPSASILGLEPSLDNLLTGGPVPVTISVEPAAGGKIQFLSLFAQDTFRWSEKLTLLYGIRWEFTPPPSARVEIPTLSGMWNGTNWQTVYAGDVDAAGPWPMRYGQIAPRLGIAYRLPWAGLVLHSGAGVFYDTVLAAAIDPISGAPFNTWLLPGGAGIVDGSALGSSAPGWSWNGPNDDVQQFLTGPRPALRLPISYQWRTSLERRFGEHGAGSIAYVGSGGRHLLGNEAYVDPGTGVLNRMAMVTQNSSSYQALQARYSGSLTRALFGSVSYTWAHSIDDGSQDSSLFLIHPGYRLSEARGSSSFDVRHTVTAAMSYQVPRTTAAGRIPLWLAGWTISGIFRMRSGFPLDVFNAEPPLGQAFDNVGRPNLVLGESIWLNDSAVPGSRRLNPKAFAVPANGAQGTLGRDTLYGNGLLQLDLSIRREFPLYRRSSLEAALNIFNLPNHPAFADPVPYVSSPLFGQSTSMQNLMLGSGTPNSGLSPLFQGGGARSVELSLRFSF